MECNNLLTLTYLDGDNNQISLPDPNHNAKTLQYQLIYRSPPATIENFIFDPYKFVLEGVAKNDISYQDYESYALVLHLEPHKIANKWCSLNSYDVGNFIVMLVYLTIVRMCLFYLNPQNTTWKFRAIITYISTIWFTYFHTFGSNKMFPNKHNMML